MRNIFEGTKKVVIKVGSTLLVKDGEVRYSWLESLVSDVRLLIDSDIEVVVVASGAVALGRSYFDEGSKRLTISQKQAAAAVGQINLMASFQKIANIGGSQIAQVLLSASDFDDRKRYDNLNNIFRELSLKKITPIVNENDSVSIEEIQIGDNDRLAARVAQTCDADLLILFSDIDGLYNKNPNLHKDAKFIHVVENITREIENMAGGSSSTYGTGGMKTKITAAKMASLTGCKTIIASGIGNNPVISIMQEDAKYTLFNASKESLAERKQWLSGFLEEKGEVIVDKKAVEILSKGGVSLLPVGIVKISGDFNEGDLIFVRDENGDHIASGHANYDHVSAKKVIGKRSDEVREILGDIKSELIHVDNLVLIKAVF